MTASMILDGLIALLLVITISYCWRLSNKITLLHAGREELNKFIQDFNSAILRAEKNIEELKTLGQKNDEHIQEHIQKARFIANDLSFLTEKADSAADKLELYITSSQIVSRSISPATNRATSPLKKNPEQIKTPTSNKSANFSTQQSLSRNNKSWDFDEQAKPTINHMTNNTKQQAQPQPPVKNTKTAASTSQPIPPSKKKALDDVLAQIASRKGGASNSTTTNNDAKSNKQNNNPQTVRIES